MKKNVLFTLSVVLLLFFVSVNPVKAEIFDYSGKITEIFVNDTGAILIKISVSNNSPGGSLRISGVLSDPVTKALFTVASLAQVTQKTCWVRVVSNPTTYWTVSIINMY